MVATSVLVVFIASLRAVALLNILSHPQKGVPIAAPPRPTNTGILPIPDLAHPFRAPRLNDKRGPCPGLNTLANHGLIPRNGIASFEEIVVATTHAFNMDYDLASTLTAFAILARGNAFINRLSIGLPSPLVPPLPGKIDGPIARGLAGHGRVEGDVSMTRKGAAIGDNRNFQADLYAKLLDLVSQFGDDSPVTGPKSIVNIQVMQEFKYNTFLENQAADKHLQYHVGRFLLSYGEAAFTLNFFANGTDGTLSAPTMTSFFRDQRFPANWYRRSSVAGMDRIGDDAATILQAHPVSPGENDANGVYVPDSTEITHCALYENLTGDNLPGVLMNTTGLLRRNVQFLLKVMHDLFPECPRAIPHGAANE